MPVTLVVKTCRICQKTQDLIYFAVRPDSKDGYRNSCKPCDAAKTAKWRSENHELAKQSQRNCYAKNSQHYKDYQKQYAIDNPLKVKMRNARKYSNVDKSILKKRSHRAYKKNPKAALALTQLYRNKLSRTFCKKFLTDVKQFYKECPKDMEVDHIIPINNEFVSGLHVVWNLQYLPIKLNRKKSNRFDGTYENNSWTFECR